MVSKGFLQTSRSGHLIMKYYQVILVKDYYGTLGTPCLVYDLSKDNKEVFFSPDRKKAVEYITQMREMFPKSSYKLVSIDVTLYY